jgi:uncharacterized phage protein (TIGR02220 family)
VTATFKPIHRCHQKYESRQNPGGGLDACKSVINWLADAWQGTPGQRYLTAETIFRPTKFDTRWAEIQAGTPPPRWGDNT